MTAADALRQLGAVDYYLHALTESTDAWSFDDVVRMLNKAERQLDRYRQICAELEGMLRDAEAEAA